MKTQKTYKQLNTTTSKKPPMRVSEETKRNHLELAKKQGEALKAALDEMTQNIAQRGSEKRAGHYLIGYAVEKPEGMYHVMGNELSWHEPRDENIHIEISVRDGGDGRFIPALDVRLTVLNAEGEVVGTHQHPFLWHPWLYHYGRNWKLPGSGKYTFQIHIDMPNFHRHDKENGRRFTEPVDIVFKDIEIQIEKPQ